MEWAQLMQGKDVSLERALAAFDIFVLHDREGDFDDISACLDLLAQRIRDAYPGLEQESPRQKAVIIAIYVRTHGFAGVNESSRYHDLRNNFLGIALFQEDHSSLSLISVVIYCCIATRLGLDAQPCCFPFHVLAIIKPSGGCDLDEKPLAEKVVPAPMYMDPYRTEQETPVADLKAQLLTMGALSSSHAMYLDASPVGDIVLRSARNIINSVQHAYSNAVTGQGHDGTGHLSLMHTFPDMESAFYSALWALLLLGMPPDGDGLPVQAGTRRQYLPYIIQHLESHFPMDVSLIEEHIEPLFEGSGERGQLRDTIRVMRAGDVMAKQLKPRSREVNQQVRFRVGQVFKHKRYSYQAVITGWDVECGAGEHWMAQMRIHELSRGKHQSFYHVLVEDKSVRYVAEENIEIIKPAVPFGLLPLAGRYFRRWDRDTCTFISNIKDEYPDD
ncbi:MAG: hypothetical protein MMC33_006920 [Icmadophila ericetorum]|nr:hypothetical protein [Icmadophila ericetorum]